MAHIAEGMGVCVRRQRRYVGIDLNDHPIGVGVLAEVVLCRDPVEVPERVARGREALGLVDVNVTVLRELSSRGAVRGTSAGLASHVKLFIPDPIDVVRVLGRATTVIGRRRRWRAFKRKHGHRSRRAL